MIVGTGDIARVLKDRNDLIFFAAGVSDSSCDSEKEFKRERKLLLKQKRKHIVYFSTLSIYEKDTPYTRHKIEMEQLVKDNFYLYTIIRIGNISWGCNPKTIINYFNYCIENKIGVFIRHEYKYICSLEEFHYWIAKIPNFSTEMNITSGRISVRKLYKQLWTRHNSAKK